MHFIQLINRVYYFNENHNQLPETKYNKPKEIVGEKIIINLFVSKTKIIFYLKAIIMHEKKV